MIYAIPHSRNCVANHFMKAANFSFYDEDNSLIHNMHNPAGAGNSSCQDKKALISAIQNMNTDAIIVRNIGERALGKLLKAGIRVYQLDSQTPVTEALSGPMTELTQASQGRPSRKHDKKGGCSGGCGSDHGAAHQCCGSKHQHAHGKPSGLHQGKTMRRAFTGISSVKPLNTNR